MVNESATQFVDGAPSQFNAASPAVPELFLGTYTPKIDAKGRLTLPAKFRHLLGEGLVLARGQERCISILPQSEFQRMAQQIQITSMGNPAARRYLRVFLSGASQEVPDKQGRVLIAPNLREYASLGDDIVVIGVGTRAEIWNREAWESYLREQEEAYADMQMDVLAPIDMPIGG